jgi:proline iminopeptidase
VTFTGEAVHAWQWLYPPLQVHASGWLAVDGGHRIHWEECGHPLGLPALFVHSGPGAGCRPDDRRWFDPQRYRIILFDQRGTGRSQPLGRTTRNRTSLLVADMERLRRHLGIARWLLLGGSWGATLALAYAQRHRERVAALVLRAPFAATARERRWLYGASGVAVGMAQAWRRFSPQGDRPLPPLAKALRSARPGEREAAARAWLRWEAELDRAEDTALREPDARAQAMARIGVHYARHRFFVDGERLLAGAARLGGVPGVILQGMQDRITPGFAAARLHRAWSGSELRLLPDTGHASSEPAMARALVEATDAFAARPGLWRGERS